MPLLPASYNSSLCCVFKSFSLTLCPFVCVLTSVLSPGSHRVSYLHLLLLFLCFLLDFCSLQKLCFLLLDCCFSCPCFHCLFGISSVSKTRILFLQLVAMILAFESLLTISRHLRNSPLSFLKTMR